MQNPVTIRFLGGAGTVTGSRYLIETPEKRILIDCGLFQGVKKLRLLNRRPLPVDPRDIDCVLLTHGHLDHTGYLPVLVRAGFRGAVYATAPTIEIATIILQDSARIQEEDAARANAGGYSRHTPAMPLYGLADVQEALKFFTVQPLDKWTPLSQNISFRFRYNGHILGAVFIELNVFGKLIVFSGDIGRSHDPLMHSPGKPEKADVLIVESTYGDRFHPDDAALQLSRIVKDASAKGGTIVIPGFAVERMQLLMHLIWRMNVLYRIPQLLVYLDSPMGLKVWDVFRQFGEGGWHKLSEADLDAIANCVRLVQSGDDTSRLISDKACKIIIAGSGMASGGRVLSYFQKYLGDPAATIVLTGYQAEGTRGRQLLEGAPEIKLYGKYYPVKASVANLKGLSAHADQRELLEWMGGIRNEPERTFIVHGEAQASDALRVKLETEYGWHCEIPTLDQSCQLFTTSPRQTHRPNK